MVLYTAPIFALAASLSLVAAAPTDEFTPFNDIRPFNSNPLQARQSGECYPGDSPCPDGNGCAPSGSTCCTGKYIVTRTGPSSFCRSHAGTDYYCPVGTKCTATSCCSGLCIGGGGDAATGTGSGGNAYTGVAYTSAANYYTSLDASSAAFGPLTTGGGVGFTIGNSHTTAVVGASTAVVNGVGSSANAAVPTFGVASASVANAGVSVIGNGAGTTNTPAAAGGIPLKASGASIVTIHVLGLVTAVIVATFV